MIAERGGFFSAGSPSVSYRMLIFVLDRVDHSDNALLHRNGKPVLFRCPHDMAADEIDFRLSSIFKIGVDARVSVGRVFEMPADPFDLLFLVKYAFLQSCRPADFPDQILADLPARRIRSYIALSYAEHPGKNARRRVDHQLVPDSEADVPADRTWES